MSKKTAYLKLDIDGRFWEFRTPFGYSISMRPDGRWKIVDSVGRVTNFARLEEAFREILPILENLTKRVTAGEESAR